jgi:hypothetical protein
VQPQHLGLLFVHGETRINEQDPVFSLDSSAGHHHGEKASLHRTHRGQAMGRLHVGVQKFSDESGDFVFQIGNAVKRWVNRANAFFEGTDLPIYGYLRRGHSGDAHLHADEPLSGFLFDFADQPVQFTDGGQSHTGQFAFSNFFPNDSPGNRGSHDELSPLCVMPGLYNTGIRLSTGRGKGSYP